MKIVITSNTAWNVYNFRLGLINELQKEGHQIYCIAPQDEYVGFLEEEGITHISIKMNQKGTNPIDDIWVVSQYLRIFKSVNPDLILSYTIKPNIYGSIAARFLNIPVINNISGLGTLFIKKSIATYIAKFLYKFGLSSSYHIYFQNSSDHAEFVSSNLVNPHNSSVIPGSGVNTNEFFFDRTENKGNRFLFVGRLIGDKGIIEYIESAIKVLSKYPLKEFYIVGELGYNNKTSIGKEKLNYYLKKYPQIKYLGKTDDVISILKCVDIIILPSYREGLSKCLIEACSMQLPIVTTNVPGCKDVVDDGINGYLCNPKDSLDLSKKILQIIQLSEVDRLRMGRRGREKAMNQFDEKLIINEYKAKIDEASVSFLNSYKESRLS